MKKLMQEMMFRGWSEIAIVANGPHYEIYAVSKTDRLLLGVSGTVDGAIEDALSYIAN